MKSKANFLSMVVLLTTLLASCGGTSTSTPQITGTPIPPRTTATVSAIPSAVSTEEAVPWFLPPDIVDTHQVIYVDVSGNLRRLNLEDRTIEALDTGCNSGEIYLSPDGSKIVYNFYRDEFTTGNWYFRTALLDLQNGRRVQLNDPAGEIIWAPNGNYFIAFLFSEAYRGPAVVSAVDGSTIVPVNQLNFWHFDISPKDQIFFSDAEENWRAIGTAGIRFNASGWAAEIVEALTRTMRPDVVTNDRAILTISISPDGGRIAFILDNPPPATTPIGTRADIYVMDSDGSNLLNLTGGTFIQEERGLVERLYWSPDGSRIAFESYALVDATLNDHRIHVVNADGSGMVEATGGDYPNGWKPSWSPDGSQILFTTLDANYLNRQVVIVDLDGLTRNVLREAKQPFIAAYRPGYSLDAAAVNCAARFTRLDIGMQAVVSAGDPNRVRSEPARGDSVIDSIYPGTVVQVIDGPICTSEMVFWKVASVEIPGGSGWTAEGDWYEYWLEPYKP